jgi:hypothetical protein
MGRTEWLRSKTIILVGLRRSPKLRDQSKLFVADATLRIIESNDSASLLHEPKLLHRARTPARTQNARPQNARLTTGSMTRLPNSSGAEGTAQPPPGRSRPP